MEPEFIILALFLGAIPAIIAKGKGRNFAVWYIYGVLLFIVALIHSLVISKDPEQKAKEMQENGYVECPFCKEFVKKGASVCPHCRNDVSGKV